MSTNNLNDVLIEQLKDLYHAEGQLLKALPKMAKAAESEELKQALQDHLSETEGQVQRLESVFEKLETPAKGKVCPAMKGLIEEGSEVLSEMKASPLRDVLIIASAQKIEHYEIAAYGTVRTLADTLGETEVSDLLQETLDEEGEADKKLTALAEAINDEALALSEAE